MLSLKEIAEKYQISRKTLRYYDEINLLKAIRKENSYRYYDDILERKLKYILVMKKGGFSLEEMKKIFELNDSSDKEDSGVIKMLSDKQKSILQEIKALEGIIDLINLFESDCKKYDPSENMKLVNKILGIEDEE